MRALTRGGRGAVRLLAVCACALVLAVSAWPAAQAHDELLFSSPAVDMVLTVPPAEVVLRFEEPVDPQLSTIVVRDPDGVNRAQGRPSLSLDEALVVGLSQEGSEGRWSIDYRVVATDGHPVTGSVDFIVGDGTARFDNQGTSGWLLAFGALGALVLVGVVAARLAVGRPTSSPEGARASAYDEPVVR